MSAFAERRSSFWVSNNLADLQDEVIFAVQKEFGLCDDWTAVNVYQSLLDTVARISAHVFVGLPLCRDDEWIKFTTHYTEDVVIGFRAISKYPLAPFIPELSTLNHAHSSSSREDDRTHGGYHYEQHQVVSKHII